VEGADVRFQLHRYRGYRPPTDDTTLVFESDDVDDFRAELKGKPWHHVTQYGRPIEERPEWCEYDYSIWVDGKRHPGEIPSWLNTAKLGQQPLSDRTRGRRWRVIAKKMREWNDAETFTVASLDELLNNAYGVNSVKNILSVMRAAGIVERVVQSGQLMYYLTADGRDWADRVTLSGR